MDIKRKKLLLWTAFFLVVTAFFLGYWFYQSILTDFPGKKFAKSEIVDLFPEADIQEIQEIIMLDEKHVFTPFTTNQQSYGGSLWEWKYNKWQLISIDTDFKPRIWKAEPENPASYIILWNFHPKNNLKSLTIYLKKEKGYSVTEGKELYQPSIQMEYTQPLDGKLSYGYMKIPRQWKEFITIENPKYLILFLERCICSRNTTLAGGQNQLMGPKIFHGFLNIIMDLEQEIIWLNK